VHVTGNMKYDSVLIAAPTQETSVLRRWLSPDDRLVVVAGSTHGEEDRWLAQALDRIRPSLASAVRLVVVPRHPERAPAVCEALRGAGHDVLRWSSAQDALPALGADTLVVVDTIGQLQRFYGACDVAFVGGSLVPHGGQNMLEPAALGRAVLFGPHTDNFRTDVELLRRAEAAIEVRGPDQLADQLKALLQSARLREELGVRATRVIAENRGATDRTLELVAPLLEDPGQA
jgi:3-deoxy-D-manno-octulosonic-acid transferase